MSEERKSEGIPIPKEEVEKHLQAFEVMNNLELEDEEIITYIEEA